MSVLIVLGSARGESHTRQLLDAMVAGHPHSELDLLELEIQHFEYGGAADRDDFGRVAEAMATHSRILVATPVYWYAMSGRMKVLFDRLTDLVTVRKDLGRRLRGRSLYVLACGTEPGLPEGFEVPFRETAKYLGMIYGGAVYGQTDEEGPVASALDEVVAFAGTVFSQ